MKLTSLTLAFAMTAGAAAATTTGFTLDFRGNGNTPTLALTNIGTLGDITGFTLSLGDTTRNFDTAFFTTPLVGDFSFTLDPNLDTNGGGGLRADALSFTFSDFNPNEVFETRVDVDLDNSNTIENYVDSLLPGGSIVVNFAGGLTDSLFLDLTRPDGEEEQATYSYTAQVTVQQPSAVPLPAGLPLLLAGLGALGIARRKRG